MDWGLYDHISCCYCAEGEDCHGLEKALLSVSHGSYVCVCVRVGWESLCVKEMVCVSMKTCKRFEGIS